MWLPSKRAASGNLFYPVINGRPACSTANQFRRDTRHLDLGITSFNGKSAYLLKWSDIFINFDAVIQFIVGLALDPSSLRHMFHPTYFPAGTTAVFIHRKILKWRCYHNVAGIWAPHTGSSKINGAKLSDTCSVRANWLCMSWSFYLAVMRREIQTGGNFFCTTLYTVKRSSLAH